MATARATRPATASSTTCRVRDPAAVQPAHALGVDELAADPQPGEEGAGHARPALVQELDERRVGADGDDQLGALVVGQQHRDVLAGAGGGEDDRLDAELLAPAPARAPARRGRRGRRSRRRSAARASRHGVHVADDHVGLVAGLEQRVGAAVDADEHRPVLPDVGAQRREVLLVVVAPDDDEHVPAVELRCGCRARRRRRAAARARGAGTPWCSRRTPRAGRRGPARASVIAAVDGLGVLRGALGRPRSSPTQTAPSWTRTRRPPATAVSTSGPTSSISGMPASSRISGPRLG